MRTLAAGGWFNWVGHGERVIVHCPAPGGVTFLVGQALDSRRLAITAEIRDAGTACPMKYGKGQQFEVATDHEGLRAMEIFEQALPSVIAGC
jgi:hypothetical protein